MSAITTPQPAAARLPNRIIAVSGFFALLLVAGLAIANHCSFFPRKRGPMGLVSLGTHLWAIYVALAAILLAVRYRTDGK